MTVESYEWMPSYKLTDLQKNTIESTASRVWAIFRFYNMKWHNREEPYTPSREEIQGIYTMLADMLLKYKGERTIESAGGLYVQIMDITPDNQVKFDYGMSIKDDVEDEGFAEVVRDVKQGEEKRKLDKEQGEKPV